ncbi:MAG: phage regulatory protein/antirepressor Ant [Bacteroidales bacterium]|nr:phage regulatory protein/antirepressor Ant [Bacteroidales bacterium]MCM1148153.1 phage regulatory protein/antirepressor Ant [Bacteroidales bacterium]MCM1207120.1 phage regulatory protein/antirepressor Ant [Bacillota bacterium]MCM1510872.1 phage regulatory protein/antirepressor Ant [Clostridium sp.]
MDYITSLQIAEITGKQHSNIMRDIRNLLEQLEDRGAFNFELTSYTDKSNRQSSCYNLTKRDCLLLASGYDANLRAKIINRLEELETEKHSGGYQVPQSYSEALMLAARQAEQLENAQRRIECQSETIESQSRELQKAAPKVQYVDEVLQSVNTYTATQIAKEVGMDAAKFHRALKERKVMFKQSGTWMLTAKYQDQGYTKMRTHQFTRNDGSIGTSSYTVFTEAGRAFVHSLLGSN